MAAVHLVVQLAVVPSGYVERRVVALGRGLWEAATYADGTGRVLREHSEAEARAAL